MFEFEALTKRDWALVALIVIGAGLALALGMHCLLNVN